MEADDVLIPELLDLLSGEKQHTLLGAPLGGGLALVGSSGRWQSRTSGQGSASGTPRFPGWRGVNRAGSRRCPRHPAVAEPQMRHRYDRRHALEHDDLVAPVELVGLYRGAKLSGTKAVVVALCWGRHRAA
jgi:hypothetical protein